MAPSQELALPVERELVCNHLPTIQKDEEAKTFVHTYTNTKTCNYVINLFYNS